MQTVTNNELFNSKTKISDVLKYSISEIAKFRWEEYQKCWTLANFLWWEYQRIDKQLPDIFKPIKFWEQAKPKKQLAEDVIIYARKKEELYDFIKQVNLTHNLFLHDNDLDKYLDEVSKITRDIIIAQETEFLNAITGSSKQSNQHLIKNATHLKITWKA
jgi:hypothetical protein